MLTVLIDTSGLMERNRLVTKVSDNATVKDGYWWRRFARWTKQHDKCYTASHELA